MRVETISKSVTDGDVITLPNNVIDISFEAESMGRATAVWVHAYYQLDGRVGETEYRVSCVEAWDGNDIEVPDADFSAIVHARGRQFRIVSLTGVSE